MGAGHEDVGWDELRRAFEAVEELERARSARLGVEPGVFVIVDEEAPGLHRSPLVSDETFRELYEAGRVRRGPTFRDVMDEFSRRSLSVRRHPSSQPVDEGDGSGTTGP